MFHEPFLGLVNNAALLLALSVLYSILALQVKKKNIWTESLAGLLLGTFTVILMLNPWVLQAGIIFDTRSILLSIIAMFFGILPTLIATACAVFFRAYSGGAGAGVGISVIISSVICGIVWKYLHAKRKSPDSTWEFYSLGLLTHISMLLLMLFLPNGAGMKVLKTIGLPVIIIYPVVTVLLGKHLSRLKQRYAETTEIQTREETYRTLYESAPIAYQSLNQTGEILFVNKRWLEILGYTAEEVIGKKFSDLIHPDSQEFFFDCFKQFIKEGVADNKNVLLIKKDGSAIMANFSARVLYAEDGSFRFTQGIFSDVTENAKRDEALRNIEWMLTKEHIELQSESSYGDLTELNTCRTILDAVGKEVLQEIVIDYLSLLDTSAAVYEVNGDYAMGIFSSSWCQFLDSTSRKLCNTDDDRIALDCGLWHCHESCWTDVSKTCIQTAEVVDKECSGALHLYAVPIFAFGKVVGAINLGYGSPPSDSKTLGEISTKYQIPLSELQKRAKEYKTRPSFIIEQAKRKLHTAARIIGEIVERKQGEQALKELSIRYEAILSSAPDIIIEVDADKIYTRANQAGYDFFGEDLIGKEAKYYFYGEQKTYEIVQPLFIGDEHVIYVESWQRRKDGEARLLAWWSKLLTDTQGNPRGAISTARDITEHRNAEQELLRSEEKYRRFIDTANEGVWMMDANYSTTYVNRQLLEMLGYTEAEMLGKQVSSFMVKDDIPAHKSVMEARKMGLSSKYERRFIRKDGSILWALVSATPIQNDDASFAGSFAMFTDITEIKKAAEVQNRYAEELEQEVKARTEQLTRVNMELETYSYLVAHDLRTPLRAISGFSQIITEDYAEHIPAEVQKLMRKVAENTLTMEGMIRSLLELAKLERNIININHLDMMKLVQAVYEELFDAQIKEEYTLEISPLPNIYADHALMHDLWQNLIGNAIKFSMTSPVKKIEISCTEDEKYYTFQIKDYGVGFNPKYMDNIWAIFKRLHDPDQYEGSGIGLSIAQKIVHRHKGKIWAASEEGKGASFYFTIPKDPACYLEENTEKK